MFDLLIERIVPVETGGDGMMLTLPELFSQLGRDAIDGFPGLAAIKRKRGTNSWLSSERLRCTSWTPAMNRRKIPMRLAEPAGGPLA